MILPLSSLALGAILLSSPLVAALSPSDIPADTPVAQLLKSATANLAAGNAQDALVYFDKAVTRDPRNYLTLFKRGAAYLSLGKNQQAQHDFDKVLELKPGFEGALVQRAKIKSRSGNWAAARKDYEAAGKLGGEEIATLEEAQAAALLAVEAAERGDWEACVAQAGVAIIVAGTASDLRRLRSRCRFERGEVMEGVSDLQHLLQINSGSTEPYLKISTMTFYALGETEKGLQEIRKCFQSDPDSKACMKVMKREKAIEKQLKKLRQFMERRQFVSATKLLVPSGEDTGLLADVKEDINSYKDQDIIHKSSPDGLYTTLVEMTCEAYVETNNNKKAQLYCVEALSLSPTSLFGLLSQARKQLDADDFEGAIRTLNEAKEHHQSNGKVQEQLQKAHLELKKSKQKDYYKVLGVPRDADDRTIKRAWRDLTKKFHPDKAPAHGIAPEEAQMKMAAINEAYEILSDPELKARFDNGDDPNNPEQQQGHPFHGSPFGQGGQQFMFRQGGGGFKFQQGGGFNFPGGF
ncbi:DnaJ domain-containing protein [Lophium mytilinum]|uniref:Tetratricopeptide repeat and J domain-containing co-chaperone DNJ1 n=1 Tax=Lophium mytilinum TaxID=390894 RepID=A0A6A6R9G5_9PEZI|nr:DnaJ domain-containing protein [Lophium mytilinum]